jgi:hypothetical protein
VNSINEEIKIENDKITKISYLENETTTTNPSINNEIKEKKNEEINLPSYVEYLSKIPVEIYLNLLEDREIYKIEILDILKLPFDIVFYFVHIINFILLLLFSLLDFTITKK